jgi:uncharacterized Fe-S center protein
MRKPTAYYSNIRDDGDCPMDKISGLLEKIKIRELVKKDDIVAIKTHFGEEGSVRYIRPTYIREVVDAVHGARGKPFVTDTTALYPGPRFNAPEYLKTAARNGFNGESMNAPIIIADGTRGYDGVFTSVNSQQSTDHRSILEEVHVARAVAESDKMLVVSHFKLHEFAGFGGAIKNLGMGCVTKVTKSACHHVNRPIYQPKKCTGCFDCIDACKYDCIKKKGKRIEFDRVECNGCLACYFGCGSKAWKLPGKITDNLQIGLAESAKGVVDVVGVKNIVYVNMLIDIVEFCDCAPMSGIPIVHDIGFLASADPVALDAACVELINSEVKRTGVKAKSWDYKKQVNQLTLAEKVGLGCKEHKLVTL